jgi:hypothetical protein
MGKIAKLISYLSDSNHFSKYLSIFRVFLCFHIFKKVYFIWGSQTLLFKKGVFFENKKIFIDYLGVNSNYILENSSIFLFSIIITVIILLFGIGKKLTIVLLYLQIKILQELTYPILNGGDNLMIFVLLYFIFSNSFDYLTVNKTREKHTKISNIISNLAVYSICFHLGYVYFTSAIHKIHSDVWFNGTALYYILNLERFSSPISYLINKNGFIITLSTYITIMFELLFIFFIWRKNARILFIVMGIFLHTGIYFFMMIYDFEIFYISLYGFFLPNSFWLKIENKITQQLTLLKNKLYEIKTH